MAGCRCRYLDPPYRDGIARRQRRRMPIPTTRKPASHGWGRIERRLAREGIQRVEREVVRMRMRQQDGIQCRQVLESNPGRADPREYPSQARREVGVGKKTYAVELQQQRRVPDVGNAKRTAAPCFLPARISSRAYCRGVAGAGGGPTFWRSFEISHCCGSAAMFCTA